MALKALALMYGLVVFVYVSNVGQLVHGTDDPSWLERLGR